METTPFPYHGPLPPDQVTGRDDVVGRLVEQVTSGRPTVLVAPRRFGKTSVLRRMAAQLAPTNDVIEVDLYELRSWADLAGRLDEALVGVTGAARTRLREIAMGFQINLGVVSARVTSSSTSHPDLTVDGLVNVIVEHATRHPTTLVLDEFSSIVRLDGAAGLLRTKLQRYFSSMGLVFAGSQPSTMKMLFGASDQPFFSQADLITLPGLDAATINRMIDDGFGGNAPSRLAAQIAEFTGGHPQRTMQLADAAWRHRELGDDVRLWTVALDDVRRSVADHFEARFAATPPAEQAVLRLVAGDHPLFGRHAEVLSLSPSSATRAKRSLIDDGQLAANDDGLRLVDPLFGDWTQHRFPL